MTDLIEEHEWLLWHAYAEAILEFKSLESAVDAGDQEALALYRAAVDRAIELARLLYQPEALVRH